MAFIDADEFLVPKRGGEHPRGARPSRRGAQPLAALAHVRPLGPRRAARGRGPAQLPAAGARPDERGARGARVQVPGRSLPPDGGARAFDGDRRLGAHAQRPGRRGRGAGARPRRGSIRPTTCSSTTTTRARSRSSRPRSGVARTSRRSGPSTRARCGVPSPTSRRTRSRTAPRSTISRGSGGRRRADRADRRDLQQPAGARALPDLGGPAERAARLDLHRRRRLGAGDQGRDRCLRRRASGAHVPPRLARGPRLREERDPQQGDRDLGGRPPDLHRRRRADPSGLHRPPRGAGASGHVLDRQPDPARRRGDRARHAGADRGGHRLRPRVAARRTARSTASAPG